MGEEPLKKLRINLERKGWKYHRLQDGRGDLVEEALPTQGWELGRL